MIGYFIWLPVLILISLGIILQTTLGVIAAYGFWVFLSSAAIFELFLYEFIHPGESR
jgi:hypothetical protein